MVTSVLSLYISVTYLNPTPAETHNYYSIGGLCYN